MISLNKVSNSGPLGPLVLLLCFIEIPVFNANSVDPDQRSGSSLFANVPFLWPLGLNVFKLFWVKKNKQSLFLCLNFLFVLVCFTF